MPLVSAPGNRCGHDRTNPRFCDFARRGKKGHPPVIGRINALLSRAYGDRSLLKTWRTQNPSGRGRRSEKREAMVSVMQFLMTNWFQLETRRCAAPGLNYLQAPDIQHLSNRISKCDTWANYKISHSRIATVFSEFGQAGYLTSKQKREQKASGEWRASPAIRTFTKKFFMELGGEHLWKAVLKSGAKKLCVVKAKAAIYEIPLRDYLSPSWVIPPKVAHRLKKSAKIPSGYDYPHTSKPTVKADVREQEDYQKVFQQKLFELFSAHPADGPPGVRWSVEEMADNARRITDKLFGI